MAFYRLIILASLFVLFFFAVQTSSSGKHVHLLLQNETKIPRRAVQSQSSDMEVQMNVSLVQSPETPKTTDSISKKPHPSFPHNQRHFQNVQWILSFIGWGTLIVIGVIVARYCRRLPMQYDEWYSVHTLCQTAGYLVGTVGWCLAMLLGTSSEHNSSKTQRILSIIAFTFLSLQMLSTIFVRTKKEGYIKWWSICHKILGYAIVAIIIASNILEGINYQSESGGKLNLVCVAILALLLLIALSLEIFRCIKSRLFIL